MQQLRFYFDCVSDDACWTIFPGFHIVGGEKVPAGSLTDCKDACMRNDDCESIDFNEQSNGCWLLKTKDKKVEDEAITHYDNECCGKKYKKIRSVHDTDEVTSSNIYLNPT